MVQVLVKGGEAPVGENTNLNRIQNRRGGRHGEVLGWNILPETLDRDGPNGIQELGRFQGEGTRGVASKPTFILRGENHH